MNYALKNWIKRWRHTRGYGVHSPLAFSIVKECIRPDNRYGFYCDEYLDYEYHTDRIGLLRARLIIRLLHLLRPKNVWMPNADKRIVTAIRMIMPRMHIVTHRSAPKDPDFIIVFDMADTGRLWRKMEAQTECGMLAFGSADPSPDDATLELSSKDFRIFLRRSDMQKISYAL